MRRLIPAVVAHRLLGWMVSMGIVLLVSSIRCACDCSGFRSASGIWFSVCQFFSCLQPSHFGSPLPRQ